MRQLEEQLAAHQLGYEASYNRKSQTCQCNKDPMEILQALKTKQHMEILNVLASKTEAAEKTLEHYTEAQETCFQNAECYTLSVQNSNE